MWFLGLNKAGCKVAQASPNLWGFAFPSLPNESGEALRMEWWDTPPETAPRGAASVKLWCFFQPWMRVPWMGLPVESLPTCLEHMFEAWNRGIFVAPSVMKERFSLHLNARWQKQVAKQCGHLCQVGMGASVTKPIGLEVANNSCLVGIKHCVGNNTPRTSKGDHKPPFQGAL